VAGAASPSAWSSNGRDAIFYMSKNNMVFQLIITETGDKFGDFLASFEKDYIQQFNDYTKETVIEKGASAWKYTIPPTDDNVGVKQVCYILNKNGYAYIVTMMIPDMVNTGKNNTILDTIWQSLKIG
jgi:hypothetical protein